MTFPLHHRRREGSERYMLCGEAELFGFGTAVALFPGAMKDTLKEDDDHDLADQA
jgi:hypothetical protein